jgi:glucose-6-phosphate isomerase
VDGGVPNVVITLDELSDYTLGELMFFFWKSLGVSAYLLGINPFNQPGVEDMTAALKARLEVTIQHLAPSNSRRFHPMPGG